MENKNKPLDLPSNTHKSKIQQTKKIVKAKTKVLRKKKSFIKQFSELFMGEDGGSVSSYILKDIIVPTAKGIVTDVIEAITDAVKGGIEMQLFGEQTNRRQDRRGSGIYGKTSNTHTNYSNPKPARTKRTSNTRANQFDDIIVGSHREAQAVIRGLNDLIDQYGQATIADLQEIVQITGDFTDSYYGWVNLNTARVKPDRDGYLVDLPKPVYLN